MINTIQSLIKSRRSYRGEYLNTAIPRKDLKTIMEMGMCAPSGCNMQTTSFIAVDDIKILNYIKSVITPPIFETAPAIICVLTQKIYAYRNKCYNVQDYSAAIQNMLLVIKELGYESCWYEGHITDEDSLGRKIADILQVPKEYDLVCILPIGIAVGSTQNPKKKPIEQRAWFNGFGK